jgi:hypothetical protein
MGAWSQSPERLSQEQTGLKPACTWSLNTGARDRNRTDTLPFGIAADFKSAVSTSFTTRAVKVDILSVLAAALVFHRGRCVACEHHATPR